MFKRKKKKDKLSKNMYIYEELRNQSTSQHAKENKTLK